MSAVEYAEGVDRYSASAEHGQPAYRDVVPRIVTVASPAAGADWSVNVPGGMVWQVQAIAATLVTSVVVANRFAALLVGDGTTTPIRLGGAPAIVASLTTRFCWLRDYGHSITASNPSGITIAWPVIPILGGWTISSSTLAIDVGDQWSAISLFVFEVQWREMTPDDAYNWARQDWRRQYESPLLEEIN